MEEVKVKRYGVLSGFSIFFYVIMTIAYILAIWTVKSIAGSAEGAEAVSFLFIIITFLPLFILAGIIASVIGFILSSIGLALICRNDAPKEEKKGPLTAYIILEFYPIVITIAFFILLAVL